MSDWYRPLCRHIVVPLWARWEGSRYLDHLDYLERSQYFPLERIRESQWRKVHEMLAHAYASCEYYRSVFDEAGLSPDDIGDFDDFERVPLLRKQDIQERNSAMLARGVKPHFRFLTSGSTGRPVSGYWSKECNDFKRACGLRSNLWAGYRLGDRIACLYGNPEQEFSGLRRLKSLARRKLLQRTEILDMLSMSEQSMLAFAQSMRLRPPALLWGHAHGLYLLAKFLEQQRILDIRPRGMYSAGMVLHPFEREAVERVFGCVLQDRYGCEELGLIAAECRAKEGLHINTDDLYVEFLGTDGRRVAPGERGVIVVTDLSNRAMPLIRYRLEDVGVASERRCSCGRTQPLIEQLEGRVADFLITPEGKLVSGISLTDHFAGHIAGVSQMQIVQEERDLLTLRIVRGPDFGERGEREVSTLVKTFFGAAMRHRLEFVEEIEQGARGKYRFTICRVKHDLL